MTLRSVSCNDISTNQNLNPSQTLNDVNEVSNNVTHTQSITNVAVISSMRPGMIIARSSEVVSGMGDLDAGGDTLKQWSSLCAISMSNVPSFSNNVHPFSGLLTSQLQCTECKWKVKIFLYNECFLHFINKSLIVQVKNLIV